MADQAPLLKQIRIKLMGALDLYRTKISKFSEGSFFAILRATLDAVLSELRQDVEKVKK